MTKLFRFAPACAALRLVLAASPAAAGSAPLSAHAWVSGAKGVDQAACGANTAPCRTLQYAHDNIVSAGGEIEIMDPAGYGSITITKAISIVNDGVGTALIQAPANGDGIYINAGASDAIFLRGLTVEGGGSAFSGLLFYTGASLTVTDSVFRSCSYGIYIDPPAGAPTYSISNTIVSDNINYGIWVTTSSNATSNGALTDVQANHNNQDGVIISNATASLTRVTAVGNSNVGIYADKANVVVSDSTASANATGLFSFFGTVTLTRFVAAGNQNGVAATGGLIYTYGDNHITQNTSANVSATLTAVTAN